ncbi:hypothetical protein SAMN05444157_3674 [Frankineae bacterium MT45]|nr:hypothetical protein SAMN05444157_3674 [Frankineae bacterium MT45]
MGRKRMLKVVLAATVLLVGMLAVPTAAQAATPGVCPDPGITIAYANSTGIGLPTADSIGSGRGGTPPGTTDSHFCTYSVGYKSSATSQAEIVNVVWGFDYGYGTSGNLRAFAWISPAAGTVGVHLQVAPLNLGTNNGVLTSTSLNVQSGTLFAETPPVNPCHTLPGAVYISNAHVSIRFSDGTLLTANPQYADNGSTICS